MKPALVATITLTVAICFAPRCKAEQYPADIAASTQNQNPPTVTPPITSEQAATNNQARENQPPNGDTSAQWILIVVTSITAGFICWQAWETRRAAKAAAESVEAINRQAGIMDRQVKLQEAAMRQWIVTGRWTQSVQYLNGKPKTLDISFEVINPTNFPLTINEITFEINGQNLTTPLNYQLPPGPENAYWMKCSILFRGNEYEEYRNDRLVVVIEILINFADTLKHHQRQKLSRYGVFGPQHLVWRGQG